MRADYAAVSSRVREGKNPVLQFNFYGLTYKKLIYIRLNIVLQSNHYRIILVTCIRSSTQIRENVFSKGVPLLICVCCLSMALMLYSFTVS